LPHTLTASHALASGSPARADRGKSDSPQSLYPYHIRRNTQGRDSRRDSSSGTPTGLTPSLTRYTRQGLIGALRGDFGGFPTPTAIVHSYIASWNERDPEARFALVAATFADDAHYLDPLMSGSGISGIDAMIATAQQQFPGHHFTLADGPDAHNNHIRFSWTLAPAGEEAVAGGTDFALVGADGRIQSVLDPVA
jgi:hypothetical protein